MSVAAIDIGTNSVRLLITDGQGRSLLRRMEITRLGQGVDVTGRLQPEAITRTTQVLARFREDMAHHNVLRAGATATSAARDAANSTAFFDAAEAALGFRPELLSGAQEAALSFQGATAGLAPVAPPPYLVIDIGGGSTEFVLGVSAPEQLVSLNAGCVRMTERHIRSDPPASAELADCAEEIGVLLREVRESVAVERARTALGLAGTVTALAHLQQGLKAYEPSRTHHTYLRRADVEALCERLCALDRNGRARALVEPKRAEVIVVGAVIVRTVMRELGIERLLVSDADILDGLAAALRSQAAG